MKIFKTIGVVLDGTEQITVKTVSTAVETIDTVENGIKLVNESIVNTSNFASELFGEATADAKTDRLKAEINALKEQIKYEKELKKLRSDLEGVHNAEQINNNEEE